jgi:4-diphosphocytidyl-2-C-methyl-D-erythritol kinase
LTRHESWTLPAPAKLNLFLHVTGRRRDGYHTLESLMVPIDRADFITLSPREDAAVIRTGGAVGIDADNDLAIVAARLLQRECEVDRGVSIGIDKRLPMGAGLGGGSSDAATVLLGLNRLWGLDLSRERLMQIALDLGADVPFFVFGEPALARGIGEILESCSVPPSWFVVLVPTIHVSTAEIFAAAELTRNSESAKMSVFSEGYGRNDLQQAAVARFDAIGDALAALRGVAPDAGTRMTGSGACVLAAFDNEEAAQQAHSRLPRGLTGFIARALDRHPLWSFARSDVGWPAFRT